MSTVALTPEFRAAAPAVAVRLATAILLPLAALIAHAFLRNPRRVAIILPLWNRLTRAARRFTRLMDRVAAGAEQRPSRPGTSHGKRPVALPSQRGWLVADLRHEAAVYGGRLETLLAEPAAAAIVAACPPAARILRPLCRMLGIRPAALPPLPRRARPVAAPSPRAEALPAASPCMVAPPCPRARWPWFASEPARSARIRPADSPLLFHPRE